MIWSSSLFNQTNIRTRINALSELDKMSTYVETIKGLSKNLLQLSVYKATYQTAGKGDVFYCNKADPPTVNVVLHDLGFITNETFNEYLKKIESPEEDVEMDITPSICASFDIKENMLYNGYYDEKFNTSIFGSTIKIKSNDNQIESSNDVVDETIVRDRFWLLYRGLKKWSETTKAFENVCGCLPNACYCGSIDCNYCSNCQPLYECLEKDVAKKIEKELDEIFKDPFIECTAEIDKCELNSRGIECEANDVCNSGILDSQCFLCSFDRKDELCENLMFGLASGQDTTPITYMCTIAEKAIKLKGGVTLACTDTKYYIPLDSGDGFLRYIVKAYFSFERSGICPSYEKVEVLPGEEIPDKYKCGCIIGGTVSDVVSRPPPLG